MLRIEAKKKANFGRRFGSKQFTNKLIRSSRDEMLKELMKYSSILNHAIAALFTDPNLVKGSIQKSRITDNSLPISSTIVQNTDSTHKIPLQDME